jgi:hypothetical protein
MNQGFSKIWIIIIITFLITVGILVSKSSFFKIPVFSDLFYKRKIADLGIQIDPKAAESFAQKLGFGTKEGITPLMRAVPPKPITIEATDVEFTSWVNLICSKIRPISSGERGTIPPAKPTEALIECPFENFQVKFESGKIRSSAHIFKPIEGDVTVFGKVSKKDEKSVSLELEKVWLGDLPVPDIIRKKIENWAEEEINKRLQKMEYLRIDKIEILDGKARFEGILPFLLLRKTPEGWIKECEKDEDCGRNFCQQGKDGCVEITFFCLENQCSSKAKELSGYMCQPDGKCRDTCGNGICDSEYEKLHCSQDCS